MILRQILTTTFLAGCAFTLAACGSEEETGTPATDMDTTGNTATAPAAVPEPETTAPASSTPMRPLIPMLNATCPMDIEVHADEGGPIFINGNEGDLTKFSDSYFESSHDGITISLMINPDGSPDISYTAPGGANGVCTIN